jgi:ribosomal protein S18 acetylase RimI-like enzyme
VHVVAFGEHATGLVQRLHLIDGPAVPDVVISVEHPIQGQVTSSLGAASDRRWIGMAQSLQIGGGHEALSGELVGTDHAAGVEVITLVPAVVGHLIAPVGLHQGEEHRAELDRLGPCHDGVLARRTFRPLFARLGHRGADGRGERRSVASAAPGHDVEVNPLVVRTFEHRELPEAAAVAARALRDAPTTVASHGDDPIVRMARTHRTFVSLFEHVSEPQMGALCGTCPIGVAVSTPPGGCVGALFGQFASDTLAKGEPPVGTPEREHIFWARWALHDPQESHWHIGPVGVEPGFQGRGIGGAIMAALCSVLDEREAVGWLETDKEVNVRFYMAVGFEVVDHEEILEVPTWYMRREPVG